MEALSPSSYTTQVLPIRFPDPGKPEGIRTFRKPVMTLKDVSFKYEGTDKLILSKASATVTLGARVVLVGANGAGKSTFLKLMVGDLEPNEGGGELWRHHSLRVSYIAQHSLYHLEDYLNGTPQSYIQERFRQGQDREVARMKTLALTPEEKEEMAEPTKICEVIGRQQKGKALWYEVLRTGRREKDKPQWYHPNPNPHLNPNPDPHPHPHPDPNPNPILNPNPDPDPDPDHDPDPKRSCRCRRRRWPSRRPPTARARTAPRRRPRPPRDGAACSPG